MTETEFDVVVVGGGAAGVFAAIQCREAHPEATVAVLEKAPRFLTKVGISGGGRCNVTHACFDPAELVKHYPRGSRELRGPFHTWQPADTISWFESRGVAIKEESDGRMFPTTDDSQTIIDCLLAVARELGVSLVPKCAVTGLEFDEDQERFRVETSRGLYQSRHVMVASGSLKNGPLLNALDGLGHTIEPLAPSLFTFNIKDPRLKDLQGISVDPARVRIVGEAFEHTGPVLITHWGLSGPAVLKISAQAARRLQELNYEFVAEINWLADTAPQRVEEEWASCRSQHARKRVTGRPLFGMPRRLWEVLCQASGVGAETQWSQLARPVADRLKAALTACHFKVRGKSMNKEEFVTCGGVSLKEVNFKRMESRILPGLFFGGEVLDIDGITGGFNLQSAWTTGYIAGTAMGD